MSAASNYLENKLLDHVLTATGYTQPSTRYLALFTASTGLETDSPSAEVSGTNYARKAITFDAASNGSSVNSATVTFDAAGSGGWGTISHVAVMDSSTGGHVLFWGAVTTSKTIN